MRLMHEAVASNNSFSCVKPFLTKASTPHTPADGNVMCAGLAAALAAPSVNPFKGVNEGTGFSGLPRMGLSPGAAANANSGNAEQEEQQHVSSTVCCALCAVSTVCRALC